VSTRELDSLVEIALGVDGVFGSRMTGGGFGGSTVTLVHTAQAEALMDAFEADYNNNSTTHVTFHDGRAKVRCSYMSTRPGNGAMLLWDRRVCEAAPVVAPSSTPAFAPPACSHPGGKALIGESDESSAVTERAKVKCKCRQICWCFRYSSLCYDLCRSLCV
jgi:hypothetical protein